MSKVPTFKLDEELFNALSYLEDSGYIKIENGYVIGKSSDGVEVSLGSLHNKILQNALLRYLRQYPTPDYW